MAEPKLRFKDEQGREYPEWKRQKLGNIFVQTNNYSTLDDKKELYSLTVENGITPKTERYDRSFLVKKNDKFKIVHKNEFVYNPMNMTIGAVGYNNLRKDIIVSGYYVVMKSNNVSTNEYWYNWLKSPKTIRLFKQKATGSLIEKQRIQFSTFEKIKADIPSLPEQQKIADFLTTVDRQIDIQSQRVEAMKTRKKGLLQKIFSQEIRFKNEQGQVYPEWIVQKLEELVSMHARIGWQNLRTSEFLNSGDYYLVTGTDFVNGKIDFSTCHYIGKERFEQDKKIQLDNDNILITKDGTLGKVAYVDILPKPTTLNAGIFCLKSKKQNINMKYLFQYLRGPFMMQYCNRHSTGGTIKHLNQGVLITFPVPLPSLSEQQKIADFLTAVDHQIEVEEKRLETMKTIKKGLLQQMFI